MNLPPSQPIEISIEANHEEGRSYLVIQHIEASSVPNGIRLPLRSGTDLIVGAFSFLARMPGGDYAMSLSSQSEQVVELMRRFVASYDSQIQANQAQG